MMLLNDGKKYVVHFGDSIIHAPEMPENSVDMMVYSPPFPAVFAYTSKSEDLGNSEDLKGEAPLHFGFFFRQMVRLLKPGRVMMVHCTQIVRMKRSGGQGNYDFRGLLIRLAERAGFIYDYDWLVRKGPQAQAIRTKSRALQFVGLEKCRTKSRGANCDYLIKFMKPGDSEVPVDSEEQVSRNDWIDWAEGSWDDIRETDTLNTAEARGPEDVRHICALQLSVVKRLIRLYSNPEEIVFTPFAGIGTELHCALNLGRRAYGCELKREYFDAAIRNCEKAIKVQREEQEDLFGELVNVCS